jgi:hypothetical protein
MFALHSGGDGGDLVGFAEKADLEVARSELATGRDLLDPSDRDRAFYSGKVRSCHSGTIRLHNSASERLAPRTCVDR